MSDDLNQLAEATAANTLDENLPAPWVEKEQTMEQLELEKYVCQIQRTPDAWWDFPWTWEVRYDDEYIKGSYAISRRAATRKARRAAKRHHRLHSKTTSWERV